MKGFLAAAVLAIALAPAPHAAGTCARTPGSIYHEVCVDERGCTVYVWSTMPPAICV